MSSKLSETNAGLPENGRCQVKAAVDCTVLELPKRPLYSPLGYHTLPKSEAERSVLGS